MYYNVLLTVMGSAVASDRMIDSSDRDRGVAGSSLTSRGTPLHP